MKRKLKYKKLFSKLKILIDFLQREKINQYQRALPIGELLNDRWEKARKLNFGLNSSIYDSAIVIGDVKVGKNTWIGPNVILDGSGGLEIGDNCSISANVQIYSHDSVRWANSGGQEPYEYASTKIGDNCYIGPNTVIARGVSIGKGSIIGANSYVNLNLKEDSKVAGSPAKAINS